MCGSRNFRRGGGGGESRSIWQFLYIFSPKLIWLISKKIIIFQSSRGVQLFQGVQLLIPYRNPYNMIFQGGAGSGPLFPSGSALAPTDPTIHPPACTPSTNTLTHIPTHLNPHPLTHPSTHPQEALNRFDLSIIFFGIWVPDQRCILKESLRSNWRIVLKLVFKYSL